MIESVNITGDKVVSYPLHRHSFCEIMYYIEGTGCLKTEYGDYPFAPKTAIIVPRNILHGSVSDNGFKNISVGGDFGNVIVDSNPIVISSVADSEILCRLIYKNRFGNQEYLNALADCYAISLMQAYNYESQINTAVKKIVNTISENACDPEFSITNELNLSGYAEDYIRAKFKEICGETPIEFLNRLRIKNACQIGRAHV